MEKVRVRGRVAEPLGHYLNDTAVIATGLVLPYGCLRCFWDRCSRQQWVGVGGCLSAPLILL